MITKTNRILPTGLVLLLLLSFSLVDAQYVSSFNTVNKRMDSLIKLATWSTNETSKLKVLTTLAWEQFCSSRNTGSPSDAEIGKTANEALLLAHKLKDRYQEGLALYTKAAVARRKGQFSGALALFFQILKLSQEINDHSCVATQYSNIGDMYSIQGNVLEAINYYKLALESWKELGDPTSILHRYMALGNLFLAQANNTEAEKNFKSALELASQTNDISSIASSSISLGKIYTSTGKLSSADVNFRNAVKILLQLNENPVDGYLGLGWLYFTKYISSKPAAPKDSFYTVLEIFQKTLEYAKVARAEWYINESYHALAATYNQLEDYKNALHYTILQQQLSDSIMGRKALEKISVLMTEHEKEQLRLEEVAKRKIFMARELAKRETLLAEERMQQQVALANEKNLHQQELADQQLTQAKKVAAEKLSFEKAIAIERESGLKLKAEEKQRNTILFFSFAAIIISCILLLLLYKQRNLKKAAIEKATTSHQMAELEMQSLRSQLNPHFMFNSLTSIQELILMEENEKSHIYLSRFSKLLRMLLENADQPFIPLQREIEFLQLYMELENLRVPDLKYSISTDPKINPETTLIPNMILQPYIENAIWHGLSHKEFDKQLQIRISRQNGSINYEIEDNGIGRNKSSEFNIKFRNKHQSKGMELLEKRFKLLNDEFSSKINTSITDVTESNEIKGTLVTIKVPVQLAGNLLN